MPVQNKNQLSNLKENGTKSIQESFQQEMLLQKTKQKLNESQCPQKIGNSQHPQSSQSDEHLKYVKQQHSNLKNDYQDHNNLQDQIDRIKKIKTQYQEQKSQIDHLNKIVQNLKSQNQSLKFEKESARQSSGRKNCIKQSHIDSRGRQKLQENKLKKNIVNINQREFQGKIFNLDNVGVERYMSPQVGRRISTNHSRRNLGYDEKHQRKRSQNHQIFRIDQQMLIKNHHHNKKTVIASFVEELKQELQQNQRILQAEKKSHRQTKQKLEICLEQLSQYRLKLQHQRNFDILQRQNLQLKKQLQRQIQQRLLAEQRLRQRQLLLSEYESGYLTRCSQFDGQLNKMDAIYFNIQKTLKL